jgi:hypothetical protein
LRRRLYTKIPATNATPAATGNTHMAFFIPFSS